MQLPMKTNLICQEPGKRTQKVVFVLQFSRRLRETDLICKAYHTFTRILDHNKTDNMDNDDSDMLDSEQGIGKDIVDGLEIIESDLVGNHVFYVHLDALDNQEFIECLAGKTTFKQDASYILLEFLSMRNSMMKIIVCLEKKTVERGIEQSTGLI